MKRLTQEDGASPDLVAENIERMREIFPEVFADGRIDFDALKQTLGEYVDDREERYSFTWNGKSRAKQIAQTPSMGTLRPCPEESVNWDTTKNIFIEGEGFSFSNIKYVRKWFLFYSDVAPKGQQLVGQMGQQAVAPFAKQAVSQIRHPVKIVRPLGTD